MFITSELTCEFVGHFNYSILSDFFQNNTLSLYKNLE
jgi:hypothetical protein